MKIVHLIEATATGTLSMMSLLANLQSKEGSIVSVIYSERPETPEDVSLYFESSVRLKKVQMNYLKEKLSSVLHIRKELKTIDPDVLILHSSFAGFIGRIASLGLNVKCFYIPHSISFMRRDLTDLKRAGFIGLEWLASIKESTYVACSQSEQKEIQARIPFRRCVLVENAVDTQEWMSSDRDIVRQDKVISVGQIRHQKDPARYAEMCRESKMRDLPLEFFWVGDGDDELKKELLDAGVKVTGWLNRDQVRDHLAQAKFYVSTSRWEGMPVSIIEAMLSVCAVIASTCAGNIDVIEDNQTGLLFDEVGEAVEMLALLLSDEQKAQTLAQNGYVKAKRQYSVDRYLREMKDLIEGKEEGNNSI